MARSPFSPRTLWIPILAGAGILAFVLWPKHDDAKPAAKPIQTRPPVAPEPVVVAPPKPAFDLSAALVKATADLATKPVPSDEPETGEERINEIVALDACDRPTSAERAAAKRRIAQWIDARFPQEHADALKRVELRFGCADPAGVIVDASTDRTPNTSHFDTGRWWILRVTPNGITAIAERQSTARENWMEWADEGTVSTYALADIDGDGARDVVWSNTEHEGSSMRSQYTFSVWRSKLGTSTQIIANVDGYADSIIEGKRIVLGFGERDLETNPIYRCVEIDRVSTCDAAREVQRKVRARQIADRYAAGEVPERLQLADELAILQVPEAERARLLAAAPPPTPLSTMRQVTRRFLALLPRQDDLEVLTRAPHPEATAHFAAIRARLGDTSCEKTPLTADERRRAIAFTKAGGDQLAVERACGPYVWVAWSATPNPQESQGTRHETLVSIDAKTVAKVLAYESELGTPDMGITTAYAAHFYRRGDAIVGIVIHGETELSVIAGNKVVATKPGMFRFYGYRETWADQTDDLVVDQTTPAWWHATETGIESVDLEEIHALARGIDAIDTLRSFVDDPS